MTTTTMAPAGLVLPIGQFFGTFHPTAGSAERFHRVRLRDEVWELDDTRFAVWGMLHGVPERLGDTAWTRDAVREAAARANVADVDQILHGLLAEGLAVELTGGADAIVGFARAHRMGARMLGLGNSPERPWLYSIGFYDFPVVTVTRGVYDMWEWCATADNLWSMCESLAHEERRAGGADIELTDPARLLAGFLGTIHQLLAASVVYLEPRPAA